MRFYSDSELKVLTIERGKVIYKSLILYYKMSIFEFVSFLNEN